MAERPILMSAPMVRACLREVDPKTQTRRIVKAEVPEGAVDAGVISSGNPASDGLWWWLDSADLMDASPLGDEFRCPYGVPGDVLWVRENLAAAPGAIILAGGVEPDFIRYAADDAQHAIEDTEEAARRWLNLYHYDAKRRPRGSLVPAIHMPRWACRITLRITDVRVERLQAISEADALAEGVDRLRFPEVGEWGWPQRRYRELWETINGSGSWETNPWVWKIVFARAD